MEVGRRVGVRARRRLVAVAAAIAVLALAAGLARGDGLPRSRVDLSAGTVWLASPAAGVVTLVDGASDEVVGMLPVPGAAAGDDLSVAQAGTSAYVADSSRGSVSRVDGRTYEVSAPVAFGDPGTGESLQVFPSRSAVYVVDGRRRLASVTDPVSMRVHEQLSLSGPPGPDQAVVDDAGRLWVIDGDGLAWFDTTGKHRRAGLGGGSARLVLVRGRPVLIDQARQQAGELAGDGGVSSWSCLDLNSADRPRLLGSSALGQVLAALPSTGVLVASGAGPGECGQAIKGISSPGDQLGPLAESGGFVFVPNWTTGRTAVIDLSARRVVSTLDLVGPNQRLELLAHDGLVFFNDLDGDQAGVIRFDGQHWQPGRSLRKYTQGDHGAGVLASGNGAAPPGGAAGGPTPRPNTPPGGPAGDPKNPGNQPAPRDPGGTPGGTNPAGFPTGDPGAGPTDPSGAAPPGEPPPGIGTIPGDPGAPPPGGGTGPPPDGPPDPGPAKPVFGGLTADPAAITRGTPVTFTAQVANADGATWSWTFTDKATGAVQHTAADPVATTVTFPPGTPDQLQLRLTVTTAAGTMEQVVPMTTGAGLTPHITGLSASPATVEVGKPVTVTGQDLITGNRGTWTWQVFDGNGTAVTGALQQAAGTPFVTGVGTPGGYSVQVTPSFDGATGLASITQFTAAPVDTHVDVSIRFGGAGTGTVGNNVAGHCTSACTLVGQAGQQMSVGALQSRDSLFTGWNGACNISNALCTFVPTPGVVLTANFRPVVLQAANAIFATGSDNKDADTLLTVRVFSATGALVASAVNRSGEFPDGGSNVIGLGLGGTWVPADLHGGTVLVQIAPNGNDTWNFSGRVPLAFENSYAIQVTIPAISLSQNNRSATFAIP